MLFLHKINIEIFIRLVHLNQSFLFRNSITKERIKEIFVDSYNKLPKRKTIEDAEYIKNKLMPTDKERKERDSLVKAVDDTYKKSEELIKLNTIQKQDQKKYNEEYNALVEESKKLNEKLTALENKIKDKESRMSVLADYINTLKT